jgi:hypothetical protein
MLLLPEHFHPTHPTSGLNGAGHPPWGHGRNDAIDCFAKGNTPVCCEFAGTVIKLSGHAPTATTKPGGPYGWSIYVAKKWNVRAKCWEDVYYITHLGSRAAYIKVGAKVRKGQRIGTVADYAKATAGRTASHAHMGFTPGIWRP